MTPRWTDSLWDWFRRRPVWLQAAVWLLTPYLPILLLILRAPWSAKVKLGVIGGIAVLALGVAAIASVVSNPETPDTSARRSPVSPATTSPSSQSEEVLVTAECDQAFSIAASVDVMHDTLEDLDPALDACKSVKEWVLASRRYPEAVEADPRTFLQNRCSYGGPRVKQSFLCEVLAGKREPVFATSAGTAPETHPFFEGEVMKFEPVDEANLRVFLRLTNSGNEADKGECTVTAYDASKSIVGIDVWASRDQIKPKGFLILRGAIRIEDEGAFRVRRVKARDCGIST